MSNHEIKTDISNEPPYREIIGRDLEINSLLTGSVFRGPVKRVVLFEYPTAGYTRVEVRSDWVAKKLEGQWSLLLITTTSGDDAEEPILMFQEEHLKFNPSVDGTLRYRTWASEITVYPKQEGKKLSDLMSSFNS